MDPTPDYEPEVSAEEPEAPQAEAAPVAEEAPWQGVSQEEWERAQNFMQTTGPFIGALAQEIQQARMAQAQAQAQQQQAYQQPQPVELDPFEPETVQQYIDQQVAMRTQQALEQSFAPYEGMMGAVATEKGEALANAEMDAIEQAGGAFNRDVAVMLAAPLINNGVDPTEALRACAGFAQRWEAEVRQAERQNVTGEIGQLRPSPETSPFAVGAATDVPPAGRMPPGKAKYEAAVARVLSARRPINPVT